MRFRPLNEEQQRIARQIEQLLLDRGDWVPDKELVERYEIGERQLRADDLVGRPGLLDDFAISSSRGFKHLNIATVEERLKAKHKKRRTAIAYFRSIQRQEIATRNCLKGIRPMVVERHTGQVLLGLKMVHKAPPCAHFAPRRVQTP